MTIITIINSVVTSLVLVFMLLKHFTKNGWRHNLLLSHLFAIWGLLDIYKGYYFMAALCVFVSFLDFYTYKHEKQKHENNSKSDKQGDAQEK